MNDRTFLLKKRDEEKMIIINKFSESLKKRGLLKHLIFVRDTINFKGFWKTLISAIFDSLIMNRTINVFVFTFILNLVYLISKLEIILVFPVLFIINIIPILFGMFVALKTKASQLITMLIFTYICVYVYMWIGYYFLYDLFEYSDIFIKGEVKLYL